MLPAIFAIASMLQQKGKSENQDLQNQANALRQNQLQIAQPQQPNLQVPSINSVFGNY